MPGLFININDCLLFTLQLFYIGLAGLISSQNNIIFMIISIEMMLFSASLAFIFSSITLNSIHGQIFSLFILTIAGAESAIGLALVIAFYRLRQSTNIEHINMLRG